MSLPSHSFALLQDLGQLDALDRFGSELDRLFCEPTELNPTCNLW